MISTADAQPFFVAVEPEGMSWDFSGEERILLTMRGRTSIQHIELVHHRDGITIWRPGDTEVWATFDDGTAEQIGGFADIPAPWIDSGSGVDSAPPWTWPPPPPH